MPISEASTLNLVIAAGLFKFSLPNISCGYIDDPIVWDEHLNTNGLNSILSES